MCCADANEHAKGSLLVSICEAWTQDETEDSFIVLHEIAGTAHNLLLHAGHLSPAGTHACGDCTVATSLREKTPFLKPPGTRPAPHPRTPVNQAGTV